MGDEQGQALQELVSSVSNWDVNLIAMAGHWGIVCRGLIVCLRTHTPPELGMGKALLWVSRSCFYPSGY